jgi:hypothetical protein
MVKNTVGGNKQKKKKRVRSSASESQNFKNIGEPCYEEKTYYGKVLKTYGTKYEVYIFDLEIIVDAKIRGSKKMKWQCPRISIEKNPYVIIEYDTSIYKFGTIIWVYKEWEYKKLIKKGYIFNFEKDKAHTTEDDLFDYDKIKPEKKKVVKKKSYKDTMSDIYAEMDKEMYKDENTTYYEYEREAIEKKDLLNKINLND